MRASGPLEVVQPGCLIELVDYRKRIVRADAYGRGSPQGRSPLVQAFEVAVCSRVERRADASPCPQGRRMSFHAMGLKPGGTCCRGKRASQVVHRCIGRSAKGVRRSPCRSTLATR